MTDKDKLDAIRAEIHRLVDVRGYDREMANDLFTFMDSLPNEPKDKCQGCNNVKGCITCVDGSEWAHIEESESDIKAYHDRWGKSNGYIEEPVSSVWHTMDEKPPQDSNICLLWPRDNIITIGKFNGLKDFRYVSKWAYAESILNLKEEPVSDELEEAGKEWLRPQLEKYYEPYGEGKMMELTKFDGYAMLDAIEFGAEWMRKQMMRNAMPCTLGWYDGFVPEFSQEQLHDVIERNGLNVGDRISVIIIKEDCPKEIEL